MASTQIRIEKILRNFNFEFIVVLFLFDDSAASQFYAHLKFRRQGITQNTEYNIHNMAKVFKSGIIFITNLIYAWTCITNTII